eukprot:6194137-Pleurochrysis_carterae.AAC.3
MPAIDVLRAVVMFGIVSEVDRRFLSMESVVGSAEGHPRSANKERRATEGCFLDPYEIAA